MADNKPGEKTPEAPNDNPNDTTEVSEPKAPEPEKTPEVSEYAGSKLKEEITHDVSESVSKEVSQNVIQKIGKAFGLTSQEAEEELPKDKASLEKLINDRVSETLGKRDAQVRQEQEASEKTRQSQVTSIVSGWNSQYNALASQGKVPKIKDENDQSDPGVVAKRKLIQEIGNIIEENKSGEMANYTPTIHDALSRKPVRIPGADLPISGNTSSTDDGSYSHKEIHSKSFAELALESE
jgi:uncharacterized phage infection (PIP) family protein YhgE